MQLFARNVIAVRSGGAGGGEVMFLVEEAAAHAGAASAPMEEEGRAEEGESQGDADVSSWWMSHVSCVTFDALRCAACVT